MWSLSLKAEQLLFLWKYEAYFIYKHIFFIYFTKLAVRCKYLNVALTQQSLCYVYKLGGALLLLLLYYFIAFKRSVVFQSVTVDQSWRNGQTYLYIKFTVYIVKMREIWFEDILKMNFGSGIGFVSGQHFDFYQNYSCSDQMRRSERPFSLFLKLWNKRWLKRQQMAKQWHIQQNTQSLEQLKHMDIAEQPNGQNKCWHYHYTFLQTTDTLKLEMEYVKASNRRGHHTHLGDLKCVSFHAISVACNAASNNRTLFSTRING